MGGPIEVSSFFFFPEEILKLPLNLHWFVTIETLLKHFGNIYMRQYRMVIKPLSKLTVSIVL